MIGRPGNYLRYVPKYEEQYEKKLKDIKSELVDPDKYADVISDMHSLFNNRRTLSGKTFILDSTMAYNGVVFSCDSITASYRFHTGCHVIDQYRGVSEFEKKVKDFVWETYDTCGETIFPANFTKNDPRFAGRTDTINVRRGCHKNVADRIDITLECIRRYYQDKNDHSYPMEYCFHLPLQTAFFEMFKDFDDFIDFFFFNDLVEDGKVRFFIEWDGRNPYPMDIDEYYTFLDEQLRFTRARGRRIEAHLKQSGLE